MDKTTDIRETALYIPIRKRGDWKSWFPDDVIVVLAAIMGNVVGVYPCDAYINASCIAMDVFQTEKLNTEQRKYIRDGIDKIYNINPDWISPVSDNKLFWKINTKNIRTMNKEKYYYVKFYYSDIKDIIKEIPRRKITYAAFYLKLKSTFDWKYNVGYFKQDYLATIMDTTADTICHRIKDLKKIKKICVMNRTFINKDGETRNMSNIYYLPGDKEKAEKYAKEHSQSP